MAAIPLRWWLRPVMMQERLGEHSAVVCMLLYRTPLLAIRSKFGVAIGLPKHPRFPNPVSSSTMNTTFGAPFAGRIGRRPRGAGLIGGPPDHAWEGRARRVFDDRHVDPSDPMCAQQRHLRAACSTRRIASHHVRDQPHRHPGAGTCPDRLSHPGGSSSVGRAAAFQAQCQVMPGGARVELRFDRRVVRAPLPPSARYALQPIRRTGRSTRTTAPRADHAPRLQRRDHGRLANPPSARRTYPGAPGGSATTQAPPRPSRSWPSVIRFGPSSR